MKRKCLLVCIFSLAVALVSANPYTVVIDAGHGGKDAGAVGKRNVLEKNLNLDVSLRLASKIRTQFPEVKVLLTRSSDEFIPLQERADFVNKNNANLFICIHTNAAESRSAQGAEVFILGTDRMEENLDVAMRENAVMKLEANYQTAYQGFDPNSVESYIMFELMQNQYMDQSLQFASLVQNEFVGTLHRADRGVRQAAFWVLLKSACPSVLVEMGFVSNQEEEQYLSSDVGKREITNALFRAFCHYYKPGTPIQDIPDTLSATPSASPSDTAVLPTVGRRSTDGEPTASADVERPLRTPQATLETTPKTVWRVQIFVSKSILPKGDHNFQGITDYTYQQANGIYKYMAGNCATREEAVALKEQLKSKFPDCFVVKTDN